MMVQRQHESDGSDQPQHLGLPALSIAYSTADNCPLVAGFSSATNHQGFLSRIYLDFHLLHRPSDYDKQLLGFS